MKIEYDTVRAAAKHVDACHSSLMLALHRGDLKLYETPSGRPMVKLSDVVKWSKTRTRYKTR